jgi:hypothetical protein
MEGVEAVEIVVDLRCSKPLSWDEFESGGIGSTHHEDVAKGIKLKLQGK